MAGFKINCSNASTILLVVILVLVVVCILTKPNVETFRRRRRRGKNKQDKSWCQKEVCNTNRRCGGKVCSDKCPSKCESVKVAYLKRVAAAKAAKAAAATAAAETTAATATSEESSVEKSDEDYVKDLFNKILALKDKTKCTKDETGCEGFEQYGACEEPECIWINTEKPTIIESEIDAWNDVDVREHLSSETIKQIKIIKPHVNGFVKYFETLDDGLVTDNTIDDIVKAVYKYVYNEGLK
jgi:hypothetical protein